MKLFRLFAPILLAAALGVISGTGLALADGPWEWTLLGPEGGYIEALVVDPTNADIVYVGTPNGVFKSIDGGQSWSAASSGIFRYYISSLAIDPAAPTTLYATTIGGSLYKSIDGGDSWSVLTDFFIDQYIYSILVDSATPTTLYVSTEDTVYKSIDGGGSWTAIAPGNLVALHPQTSTTIYSYDNWSGAGFRKSGDGGQNWQIISHDLDGKSVRTLAVDPVTPTIMYAGAIGGGRLYKSVDGGVTWSATTLSNVYIYDLAIDPITPTIIYVATDNNLRKSVDSGTSWMEIDIGRHFLTNIEATTERLYIGTDGGGVFRSDDNGQTWQNYNQGLFGLEIWNMAIDPVTPTTMYVYGFYDNDLYKTTDDGQSWVQQKNFPGGVEMTVVSLDINPITPTTLYASIFSPSYFPDYIHVADLVRSRDGGESWESINNGLFDPATSGGVYDIQVNPVTPTTVYAASGGCQLHRSRDEGDHWTHINSGLSCVERFVVHPITPTILYAIDWGTVYVSSDEGDTWQSLLTGFTAPIFRLVVHPDLPETLFILTGLGVLKSNDGGYTWQDTGIYNTDTLSFQDLIPDPNAPDVLYLATEYGVFRYNEATGLEPIGLQEKLVSLVAFAPIDPPTLLAAGTGGVYVATPPGEVDLSITKSVTPTMAVPGQMVTYTLAFSNVGTAAAAGGSIFDDTDPSLMQNLKISGTVAITPGAAMTPPAEIHLGQIPPGAGGVITYNYLISTTQPAGPIVNNALISAHISGTEPVIVNNHSAATVTVQYEPPSGLSVVNGGPTQLGQTTWLTATLDSGSNASYVWAFGDGQTGSGAMVSHLYGSAGPYTATVTATNSAGSVATGTTVRVLAAADDPPRVYLPVIVK